MFRCQFHTAVITHTHRLVLGKDDLDDSFKDKRFPESTRVELIFQPWLGEDGSKAGGRKPHNALVVLCDCATPVHYKSA